MNCLNISITDKTWLESVQKKPVTDITMIKMIGKVSAAAMREVCLKYKQEGKPLPPAIAA